ncbi:MAG: peptidase M64 [Bacteroidaceae bacterium]|nr:peptidase M64 [Bacteroidaceae bacterium]
MNRLTALILSVLLCNLAAYTQDFDQYFEDNTLRIDYIFAGDVQKQEIYVEQLYKQPRWAGRKSRLAEKPLNGNGQLTVRDHESQQVIYVCTFSTLFQEWLQYDEAKKVKKAFQCAYNVPFPKRPIDVTITLTNNHQKVVTETTHTVDPKNILIRPIGDNGIPFHYVHKGKQALSPAFQNSKEENKDVRSGQRRDYVATDYNPFQGVDITNNVDLAILAEGYTEAQMGKFYADCQRAVDALFAREPFASLKDRFNVVAVAAPSQDSGPSVPHRGVWKRGVSDCHYDTFYSDRYLMSQNMHKIYDALSGVPFEHIMVLVNSDTYGGGGIYNQVTFSTSDHPTFKEVFVHEFGHSYAGLADEYAYDDMDSEWYPADTEPWEPNITTLHDFVSKWQDMMPKKQPIPTPLDPKVPNFKSISKDDVKAMEKLNACTQVVGVFEGAGYQSKGCYRPAQECRMKINEVQDFCPVCARAIRRITDFYTAQ